MAQGDGLVAAGVADKRVVFDLLEELRQAWEKILNEYAATHELKTERGGVRYVDAHMAAHNFLKLVLDDIAEQSGRKGEAAARFFLGAGETFQMAMRARAEEAVTGRPAGSRG